MKKIIISLATVLLFANANSKINNAPVSLELHSYQKSIIVDKKGKKVVKWVKPTKVVPGSIIKYETIIHNDTNETLSEATITSKIDKNLVFIPNSIKSKLKYEVKFSADGKNFAPTKELKIVAKNGKKYMAKPKDYRAIKFKVFNIPPKSNSTISYQAKVK